MDDAREPPGNPDEKDSGELPILEIKPPDKGVAGEGMEQVTPDAAEQDEEEKEEAKENAAFIVLPSPKYLSEEEKVP